MTNLNVNLVLRIILVIGLIWGGRFQSTGQNAKWVYLKDKPASILPEGYLDQKAIERRVRHGAVLCDEKDLPVDTNYLMLIREMSTDTIGSSRWLNAVMILATEQQLSGILGLPFVDAVREVNYTYSYYANDRDALEILEDVTRSQQIESLGYSKLQRLNATGKSIRIAVFDGGFPGVDSHEGFSHIMNQEHIVKTWNFPRRHEDVYRNNSHGTAVLSCIAGIHEEGPTGLAPDAEFLLARTELSSEPWREQLYWIQAAEWAEKNGAHIISSSLGYTKDHYFPEQMDGSSPVAEAARIAFSKGILVINSYGNDGTSKWKTGGTPADASEVLSVGAADPSSGLKLDFSSFGPSRNWVLKPDVVAAGKVIAASPSGWKTTYGTSFSAPLIAGYAACLWQLNPTMTNQEIAQLIRKSASLYPYFDYAHGYGIPSADRLDQQDSWSDHPKTGIIVKEDKIEIELPNYRDDNNPLLFVHFSDQNDRIIEYQVIRITNKKIEVPLPENGQARTFRLKFGHYATYIHLRE